MVLLTMTSSIVEGLQILNGATRCDQEPVPSLRAGLEPSLECAAVGNPVSHAQVVDLWKSLENAGHREYTLERLLKGSFVYVPPPVPKPEPVSSDRLSSKTPSLMLIYHSRTSTKLSWLDCEGNRSSRSMNA